MNYSKHLLKVFAHVALVISFANSSLFAAEINTQDATSDTSNRSSLHHPPTPPDWC